VPTVLSSVGLHLQDAGDLGDGLSVVGRFQGAGQQARLPNRLFGELGVDTRGAEEEQPIDAGVFGYVHEVDLDPHVVAEEVRGVGTVSQNTSPLAAASMTTSGRSRSKNALC